MKRLTTTLTTITVLLVFLTAASSYYKFLIAKDYIIETKIPCDPTQGICYVGACDVVQNDCSDPNNKSKYYTIAFRNAKNIDCTDDSACDFQCKAGESECGEKTCQSNNLSKVECYTEVNNSKVE